MRGMRATIEHDRIDGATTITGDRFQLRDGAILIAGSLNAQYRRDDLGKEIGYVPRREFGSQPKNVRSTSA